MDTAYAFVDEFGNTSLATEKPEVSSYFIVTAVVVSTPTPEFRAELERIRAKFFQTGEMKSSTIGQRDAKRLLILRELCGFDIRTFTLGVDKRELFKESGLAYKGSFFKFVHRMLYDRVCRSLDNVAFIADEHGSSEFMREFERYVDRQPAPNLFAKRTFSFRDSREEVLIQVADFISGSWARLWEPRKRSPKAREIAQLLSKCAVSMSIWPPRVLPEAQAASRTGDFDDLVREHCHRQAVSFLEYHRDLTSEDEDKVARRLVLEFLLFKVQFVDERAFIPTDEIVAHLDSTAGIRMSKYQIRTGVIAPLRDAGVIVASGREGYKIPAREQDLKEFAAHAQSIIPPMLTRLDKARRELAIASSGKLDILADPQFEELRCLIEGHTALRLDSLGRSTEN